MGVSSAVKSPLSQGELPIHQGRGERGQESCNISFGEAKPHRVYEAAVPPVVVSSERELTKVPSLAASLDCAYASEDPIRCTCTLGSNGLMMSKLGQRTQRIKEKKGKERRKEEERGKYYLKQSTQS
jgi:hypothetical protein